MIIPKPITHYLDVPGFNNSKHSCARWGINGINNLIILVRFSLSTDRESSL